MSYYPDDLIEEVRLRSDIVDVISQYVHLQKKGSTYFGLCPFHNEKTPSFSVTPSKQMYYCFGCGAGGNVFTFLMNYENMTFPEAMKTLADRAGIELPQSNMSREEKQKEDKRSQLMEVNKEAARYFYSLLRSPRGKRALDYFTERKLSPETMQKFGLGYSDQYSDDLYRYLRKQGYADALLKDSGLISIDEKRGGHDKFWNRAMFPIMDQNSRVIAFGGRVMGEGEPKYLNSPETMIFNKSRTLYGLHLARRTKRDYFILCEGYMDVIALHQAGFDNAIASLGTALTEEHANLIRRYQSRVYLSYDSDGAGVKAALRAIPILKAEGISCKVINMRPHKDPDEFIKALGKEAYEKRIEEAENSFLFEIRQLSLNYDMSDPENKTKFQEAVADRICVFKEETERENYLAAVANQYHWTADSFRKLVIHREPLNQGILEKREKKELKSGIQKRKQKEDGIRQSERLLLTWLSEDIHLYEMIKPYITEEDFSEGIYRTAAGELFKQYSETGKVMPASIVNLFEDEEQQREIARIFNTQAEGLLTDEIRKKALRETVIKVKQASLGRLNPAEPDNIMRIVTEKKKLQTLMSSTGLF